MAHFLLKTTTEIYNNSMQEKIDKIISQHNDLDEKECTRLLNENNNDVEKVLDLLSKRPSREQIHRERFMKLKEVREKTNMSMSACLKALEKYDNNIALAIEYLTTTYSAEVAAKKENNPLDFAVVCCKPINHKQIVYALVACQTDFAAKNKAFVDLCGLILSLEDYNNVLQQARTTLGENIQVKEKGLFEGTCVNCYIHPGDLIGSIIGMIDVVTPNFSSSDEMTKELYLDTKLLAKHVVASSSSTVEEFLGDQWIDGSFKTVADFCQAKNLKVNKFLRLNYRYGLVHS